MFPLQETRTVPNGSSMLARLRQQHERDARLEGRPSNGRE